MSTISKQLLDLQHQDPARLAAAYVALFGKEPRVRNAAWLRRQVAWKLQERELGGLGDRAMARLGELMSRIDLPVAAPDRRTTPVAQQRDAKGPSVGTTLVREWRDQRIIVEVRADGFVWNGINYKSLSACAKAITGASWNGNLFFGLTTRRTTA